MIEKIVSTGQPGAERAALDFAKRLGIPHDGWMPKGRLKEDLPTPDQYPLKEMFTSRYAESFEQNVIDSDGTLIISHGKLSAESARILEFADHQKREWLHIDLNINRGFSAARLIQLWIVENDIKVLNVAGSHSSKGLNIYEDTLRLLKAVHHLFFIEFKKSEPDNLQPLYPRTVEDAIGRLFFELPFKDKASIAKLEESELDLLHPTLGKYIREEYGLRFKKGELMKDCRFTADDKNLDENDAAAIIVKALWKKLRKTYALRVVK